MADLTVELIPLQVLMSCGCCWERAAFTYGENGCRNVSKAAGLWGSAHLAPLIVQVAVGTAGGSVMTVWRRSGDHARI